MKTRKLFLGILGCSVAFNYFGQLNPTPYNTPFANNPNQAVTTSNTAWYRGGNFPGGNTGANNILGTRWASDIWLMTNNKVLGSFTHNNAL